MLELKRPYQLSVSDTLSICILRRPSTYISLGELIIMAVNEKALCFEPWVLVDTGFKMFFLQISLFLSTVS